jgi:hypothetical protein
MAINADQLLNRPSELHRRYGGRLAMQKAQQEKMVGGGPSNIVLSKKSIKGIEGIKINVIKIEDILKGSLALDKKQLDDKKKATSKKRKDDIETKLETKPNAESGKVKMPSAPRMGILDFVKNFIGNVLLGYFAVRLIKHLPKIMPIVKFLGNATDFIINTGGELLNGLITFAQKGQEAHDKTRGFIKNLGGENFAKGFDKFIGAIDTALFLTTVLAGSMAMEAMSGDGGGGPGGGKGGGPLKSGKQIYKEYDQKRAFIRKKHGDAAARIYDNEISNGKTPKQAFENLKNRYISKGRITSQRALGLGEIKGSKLFDKGFDKAPGRLATRILGRSGKKAILGVVRPLLKRLPIIGALIDFGLSVALGEDPGRAAFKAIGAGLLGTVGAAIGSLAFGFGGIVGGILGSIGGDALGGALYDMFFGGKKPQQKGKVQGKAGGGITRGGKSAGGVKRTVSKGKYKRVLTPQKPSKTELKTEAFTKPENKTLKESTEELDKTKYFGPILAISSKIMNKEEPTDRDYQNVGLGINLLIAKGIQDKQLKGGIVAKFAEGGLVDPDVLSAAETGGDISNWVAKAFRGAIETGAQKTMRLMKEMREKNKPAGVPGSEQPGDPSMVNIQGGSADFWTLVAIASREDADPQGSADVAQSIYNRLASGAYTGKTIKDLITAGGQYEPTWQYPKGSANVKNKPNPEWFAIKDAASAAAASGMSEEAMKSVASSILNPTLQENARQFVQGRTDFKGANSGRPPSIQRKGGDNWFGWEYNYRANKIGSIPNFGATATSTPGGPGPGMSGPLGTGKASNVDQFTPIAKQFGLSVTSSYRAGDRGYHGKDRARDYSNDAVGRGTLEQLKFAQELIKTHGSSLTQLIYTPLGFGIANGKKVGLDYWGDATNAIHYHHVHVALAKGGRITKPTYALIGEKGPEFVFDADTTRGLDRLAPQLLEKLNIAKTKPQLANILEFYAPKPQSPNIASFPSYNEMSESSQTFIVQSPPPPSDDYGSDGGGGGVLIASGGGGNDPYSTLYQGG